MRGIICALVCALLCFGTPSHAKEPVPLSAYGELPAVEMMALSPGGQRIATITRIKHKRHLLVIDNGKPLSTSPIADMKVRSLNWASDDILVGVHSITFDMPFGFTTDKAELFGAIIMRHGDPKPDIVFATSPSLSNAIFGYHGIRQIKGQWKGFFSGIRYKRSGDSTGWEFDHGRRALFAVDLAKNRPDLVAPAAIEGHSHGWLVDGDGKAAAVLDKSDRGGWEIRNANGTRLAYGNDPSGAVGLVSLGKHGDSVIYGLEDSQAGLDRWFEVPLTGGTANEVFAGIDVENLFVSPSNGNLLGYVATEDNKKTAVLFDAKHQANVQKVFRAFPKLDLAIIDRTPDFSKFIVLTRGNGDSGTYYFVDLDTSRAEPIGYERPLIFAEHVGPISTVTYKADDGLELDGILTLPPGRDPKNLPIVMLPHRGPASHDVETFDWWAQAFASRGYAVFQPNFRGSTNRNLAFENAGHGQWGRKMQTDISDGLAELVKRGIADPKRACIMGAGYGGYAALAGATLQQGIYRCAVAVAPVSDLRDMYWTRYNQSGRSKMTKFNHLRVLGDPTKFDEVSPRKRAREANAPILLIHGKDDTVVAFEQSTRMVDALKSAGKPYEFVVLHEEDHWLSKSATRQQMLEEAMRFVQKHNPAD